MHYMKEANDGTGREIVRLNCMAKDLQVTHANKFASFQILLVK